MPHLRKGLLLGALFLICALVFFLFADSAEDFFTQATHQLTIKYWLLILAISSSIILLKSWRCQLLLRKAKIKLPFWKNTKVFIASQAATSLPGGETVRAGLLMKETSAPASQVTGPVLTQGFTELLSASLMLLLGSIQHPNFLFASSVTSIGICLSLFFFVHPRVFKKILTLLAMHWKFWKQKSEVLTHAQQSIQQTLISPQTGFPDRQHLFILFIACLSQLAGGVLVSVIAQGLGADIGPLSGTFIFSASVLIQGILSIIPGGLGVTEGGLAGLLASFQLPFPSVVSLILIFRAATLGLSVSLGLLFLFIFYFPTLLTRKSTPV